MAYATATDMEARFTTTELIDLTNQNDPTAQTINTTSMSVALDDASAIIDANLASRMNTPVSPPPSVLVSVCCDLARYRLYAGRSTEEVEKRYDNAIKLLKNIAAGDIDIGSQSRSKAVFSAPDTVFVGKDFL